MGVTSQVRIPGIARLKGEGTGIKEGGWKDGRSGGEVKGWCPGHRWSDCRRGGVTTQQHLKGGIGEGGVGGRERRTGERGLLY